MSLLLCGERSGLKNQTVLLECLKASTGRFKAFDMQLPNSSNTWPREGGEMANAIRQTDWALTPLGPSHHWPASLRIAVTTALDSPLPSLVMWGPELIQIYNDAYRPFLGLRHPLALGQATRVCWPEVWDFNQPIFCQVMDAGKPVHLQDQQDIIEPSGVPETRYFTVTYAALRDEGGAVCGVSVIAVETTQRILMERENRSLLEATRFADDQLRQMFEQAPNFMLVLKGPEHVCEIANAAGRRLVSGRDVVGKSMLQALPEVEAQGLIKLLDGVYRSGETFVASNRLVSFVMPAAPLNSPPVERYLDFVYQPIKDAQGQVCGIFVSGSDVTEHHHARLKLDSNLQRLQAAEARQAFQLALADRLRPLTTPEEVTVAACELLGKQLAVSRVVFSEINEANNTFFIRSDWTDGSQTSIAGVTRTLNDFGPEHLDWLRSGQVSANHDVTLDPRTAQHAAAYAQLGIRADLAVPLVKSGALTVVFSLNHALPRRWTDAEIDLVKDVAERTWAAAESVRAQAELRAERDQSQYIFDTMSEGFAVMDRDWRVTQINAVGLRIGRRSRLQVVGRILWDIWPEAKGTELEMVYQRVMTMRVSEGVQQEVHFADGHIASLAVMISPLLDGGLAIFFRDVTERNAALEAVRVSQIRAENALRISQLGTFEWNVAGNRVECSPRTREIFGFDETQGHVADDFFSRIVPADIQRVRDEIRTSFKVDRRLSTEYRIQLPDGSVRHVGSSSICHSNEGGALVRHVGVFSDATAQRQAEEKLREGDRRKDEFLAMLAHELRNPLAPITMAARILSQPGIDQGKRLEMSAIVMRQAEHMTSLIDDLLDVSRINKGLVTLDFEALDLKDVLASAVEQVRSLMEKQNHAFSIQVAGYALPVRGDRVRLVQVFSNILTNAAKYTPAGGKIALELSLANAQARVVVRDNGVGMSESLLPHIFDIFTQAERTPDRAQGGLGLGLSLVKNLVGLHGGSVTARSDGPGRGSELTVLLPLLDEAAQAAPPLPPPEVDRQAQALHIMVVDDNVDAATTVAMLLEIDGHAVSVAHSAEQALAVLAAASNPPQAFVLDIGLPGMDGYELARRLRAAPETAGATLIALTGYGQPQDRERSKAAGFNHHVEKPVDPDRLLALLNDIDAR